MLSKNLLEYYSQCLKHESYFSTELKSIDLPLAQINPSNAEEVLDKHKKLSARIKKDHQIMFGYPLLKIQGKNGLVYLPLILWSSTTFSENHNLYDVENFGFHQKVYSAIADKHALQVIANLQEQFTLNPKDFLNADVKLAQLFEIAELEERNIEYAYTIFQSKNSTPSNQHILQEIKGIIEGDFQPSHVLESYLKRSFPLPGYSVDQPLIHIVPGNLPQNTVLNDTNHTINIVKGPPGTGKTQTILNLIANQAYRQETCVIASTNNQAVDNIVEKLDANGISDLFFGYLRLGSISKNKEVALRIQSTIDRMTKLVTTDQNNMLNPEAYSSYRLKSKVLMDEITRAEKIENQIIDMTRTINELKILIDILNDRLRSNHLIPMKHDLEVLSISNQKIELRLRELVDAPSQLYGHDIFRKFRAYIAGKIRAYLKLRLKKQLKSIHAASLLEHIDSNAPFQSLAFCEEVIKVINLETRYSQLTEELSSIKKLQKESFVDLEKSYKEKNEIDLLLLQYQWLTRAIPVLKNKQEQIKIQDLIKELREYGRIKSSASSFPSFLKLFPVLLVSSLSARNCIPIGMSVDLSIVDESSQCSIPSVFCLLQSSRKACFFGDTNQLSHIVSIEDTFSKNMFKKLVPGIDAEPYCYRNNSAFERAEQACTPSGDGTHLLHYHYRCIPSIIAFSNQHFYKNRLRTMRKETERKPYASGIYSINVYGSASGTINQQELHEIDIIVGKLEENGIHQIGIITPFSAQKDQLQKKFRGKPHIKIGTVHTFQGGECKAIIFSAVISKGSTPFQIEFVQNSYRLINVALTRALDYFILVGNLSQIDSGKGYLTKLSRYIYTIESKSFHRSSIELSIAFNSIIQKENRIKLMHDGERMIYNKLLIFLGGMPLLVFPKVPIKDVLFINMKLDSVTKNFYFTSHLDFVIYEKESLQPIFSIEYDGKEHRRDPKTIKNDKMKDTLSAYAEFKLIRIRSNEEDEGWEEIKRYLQSIS